METSADTLHLERVRHGDYCDFYRLLSDPVVTHMNGRTADVDTLFQRYLNNLYSYSVFSDDTFVGLCSLFPTSVSSSLASVKALELVYSVVPDHWNCGIASFAADRICTLGFSEIGLDCIIAGCYQDNKASARVLQKSGFKQIFERRSNDPANNRIESFYLKTGLR